MGVLSKQLSGGYKQEIQGYQAFVTVLILFFLTATLGALTFANVIDFASEDSKLVAGLLWLAHALLTFVYIQWYLVRGLDRAVPGVSFELLLGIFALAFGVLTALFATDVLQLATSTQKNNLLIVSGTVCGVCTVYLAFLLVMN